MDNQSAGRSYRRRLSVNDDYTYYNSYKKHGHLLFSPQFVVNITTKTTSARCSRQVMEDFYKDLRS